MTLILDSGPLVAAADRRDPARAAAQNALLHERGPFVLPAPISAEVDYLVGKKLGRAARLGFVDDLATGRFLVDCLEPDDYAALAGLERQYADLDPGLADLSIVVLARRFGTRRILTFDERHFRAIRPLQGGSFTLLPADAKP
ncbi:MAG: PIN domain-containing protein [Actinomycetota bacterium]|nr:PIN domain-containing protein [Actinomycetota bacterium]